MNSLSLMSSEIPLMAVVLAKILVARSIPIPATNANPTGS